MMEKSKKSEHKELQKRIESAAEQIANILLECWLWREKNKKQKKKKAN